MPQYEIGAGRKALYYGGMVLMGIGLVLFLSVFVTAIGEMNRPFGFGGFGTRPSMASEFARAFTGFLLIAGGNAMRMVGARGLAGSGVLLDPQQAREDLEPWSRMAGGMIDDALSEVEALRHVAKKPQTVVKVRCRECGALNDETDKYCGQCGAKL